MIVASASVSPSVSGSWPRRAVGAQVSGEDPMYCFIPRGLLRVSAV